MTRTHLFASLVVSKTFLFVEEVTLPNSVINNWVIFSVFSAFVSRSWQIKILLISLGVIISEDNVRNDSPVSVSQTLTFVLERPVLTCYTNIYFHANIWNTCSYSLRNINAECKAENVSNTTLNAASGHYWVGLKYIPDYFVHHPLGNKRHFNSLTWIIWLPFLCSVSSGHEEGDLYSEMHCRAHFVYCLDYMFNNLRVDWMALCLCCFNPLYIVHVTL